MRATPIKPDRRKKGQTVRAIAVAKPQPDVERLAAGLLLLAEEMSAPPESEKRAA